MRRLFRQGGVQKHCRENWPWIEVSTGIPEHMEECVEIQA